MCAIIDANVVHEAFGVETRTPAGEAFLNSVNAGRLVLVAGGKGLEELDEHRGFREWRKVAVQYGKLRVIKRDLVQAQTAAVTEAGLCVSDDPHVVALAQVSGARLLFSNDGPLQRDFKTKRLVDGPRGKIFTTQGTNAVTRSHKRLLSDSSLCNEIS